MNREDTQAVEREVIEKLAARTVLVVGDLMLDRFVYGAVERISPEAPIPVLRYREEKAMLGGAGNVARNVVALNGRTVLVGAVGDDVEGRYISKTLCRDAGIDARVVTSSKSSTIIKTRFVCDGQQILRLDREDTELDDETLERSKTTISNALSGVDAMVLSDYAKGMLTPDSIRAHVAAANAAGVPVIVDPKSRDLTLYRNADVITPNAKEAALATGYDCSTDDGAGRASQAILELTEIGTVLITRGPHGMTLLAPNAGVNEPLHIPAKASAVYDVSGAGDTVIATLSLALSAGLDIKVAAQLANTAAGIVVGKLGTAAVSAEELVQAVTMAEERSFMTRDQAVTQVTQWRATGLTVGFANGCFDLVHPGHVSLLRKAREKCDRLVVALNTDMSVKRLKGDTRPIQDEASRAAVIGSLRSVDLVTLFNEETPLELIRLLRPDVLIKGEDYKIHEVVGSDIIGQWGGKILLIPLEKGHSTTNIITARRVRRSAQVRTHPASKVGRAIHIVTGGAGFIGSNIAAAIDDRGEDIVVVDTLGDDDTKWRNIAKRRLRDIITPDELPAYLVQRDGIDSVIHMGAISTTVEQDADLILRNNFRLSVDLWRWCTAAGVPFVYASSAATYGAGSNGFVDAFDDANLAALRPLNAYGWSKHVFDRWVHAEQSAGRGGPPRWAGLKFFNVFGPNEYHKGGQRSVAVQLFEQIRDSSGARLFKSDNPHYADGGQTRDFVWVGDCVEIALWLLDSDTAPSSVYNVGSGTPRTFGDTAQIMFDLLGKPLNIEFIDVPGKLRSKYQYFTLASLDKLRRAGYNNPTTSLENGLTAYVQDYLLRDDIFR